MDKLNEIITSSMDGDMYDKWGTLIDPKILGGTRKEALRVAGLGSNAPAMFRIWQKKEDPFIKVEDVTELGEQLRKGLKIDQEEEDAPLIELKPREDEVVRESPKDTLERMEDLIGKIGRLNTRMMGICEEVKIMELRVPHVFTMNQGSGGERPREPNSMALRASLVAGSEAAYQALKNFLPHTARRAKGGSTTKEQEQAPPPPPEEPSIDIGKGEKNQDEQLREEEDRKAEQRAKKRKQGGKEGKEKVGEKSKKKWKYQTSFEEGVDLENFVNKLLDGHNDLLKLKEILAIAPKLRELVKAKLVRKKVATVRLGDLIPKEANWTVVGSKMDWKSVGTGFIEVNIRGRACSRMLDTGAEMNIINLETAERLRLEVDKSDFGYLNGASGKSGHTGVTSNVIVEVERIKVCSCFYVMPSLDLPILLRRSFLSRSEAVLINKHDGTMYAISCDPVCGNFEVLTCANTGPHYSKNRLNAGSYTFEESEDKKRELEWGSGEEDEDEEDEGLVLSLANTDQAMCMVSAYAMADQEVIMALADRLGAAMTRKGGVAGPSRPASGKERRRGSRRVTRDADGMPIYKKGDNLRLFLREFEDHAFGWEWDTPTMLSKVNGVGECQLKIEEITTDCLGWMTFKTEMWVEYGDLRRDGIKDDIIFYGTNVEDFEDSLTLYAERKGWKEEEKLEQVMARVDPMEYESMRKIKEEGSKLRSDLDKLIRLHELLRDDCEWLLEGGVEVAEKLEGAGRSQRGNDEDGKMEASIKELQEMVKEKEELLNQGVASHIPEILKEIQGLRKREESRDAQVEKMEKEVESMRVEMSKVREEQQELKKQVEALNIALDSKNNEVEKERVEREKLDKEVGKLEGKVNKQEKEMEALRKVSQEGGAEMPTKIVEWNDELGFEIRSITGTLHAPEQGQRE
ncbi:hypothetical protein CBR_g4263 [Chara braunii]|uniref:Peptidase A2 domain-containing protein n=1 Tax=Chara braunii TaxID=69332 RepID=A0A388JRA9_CHABU|nr:hypothetical protein CBR_g4263 [Chara braunii]|eukprot:GBG60308.1 hypothetical protein CBR_g4263 [Chara braunii]